MNTFKNFHPLTLIFYFIFVISVSIFTFNPIYLIPALIGSLLFSARIQGIKAILRSLMGYFILFILIAITNPIFSHNGATALFFINDNRVTLEAIVYGAVLGLMIIAVLYWFRCFNEVFDSEKFLYLFGRTFPKLALVLSMTLTFVPKFIKNFRSINYSQKSITTNQSRLKRYLNSFSAVITREMENSIITSDSMNARGYGLKGRTYYSRFKFTFYDFSYLFIMTVLFVLTLTGRQEFRFYPYIIIPELNLLSLLSYVSFTVLSILPFIFELKEGVKWKYSVSKI